MTYQTKIFLLNLVLGGRPSYADRCREFFHFLFMVVLDPRSLQGLVPPARFLHVGRFGKMNQRRSAGFQWLLMVAVLDGFLVPFFRGIGLEPFSLGKKQAQHVPTSSKACQSQSVEI